MKKALFNKSTKPQNAETKSAYSRSRRRVFNKPAQRQVAGFSVLAAIGIGAIFISTTQADFHLSPQAEQLVGEPQPILAPHLKRDDESGSFEYNKNYQPQTGLAGQETAPGFSASFDADSTLGTTVTDPVTNAHLTFKPKFDLDEPIQDENRLIYPLQSKDGAKIVSLQASGFKEDIILNQDHGDSLEFSYKLSLSSGTEARLESDGSIAIYGLDQALAGDISTANEQDEELLSQFRNNAEKTNLLFTIPAPFVKEINTPDSEVDTYFTLADEVLTIHSEGLSQASYPLSIDPSVYVESAREMMRGNPETNIDFDTDNQLIRQNSLSGANFNQWNETLDINQGTWGGATAVAGGNIYLAGGSNDSGVSDDVYWARLDSQNSHISSPNPGDGTCEGWCTDEGYSLPEPLQGHTLSAYNGYLYVIGGQNGSSEFSDSVYIAKLGSNGEPRLWHPDSDDEEDWVYWYQSESLDIDPGRSYHGAAVAKNRLYILGGETEANPGGTSTVEYADIQPDGTLSQWSSNDTEPLPTGSGNHLISAEIYNDSLYVIGGVEGGVSTGNIVDTVFYAPLDDGVMSGWNETSPLSSPRMTTGGDFTAISNGYMYQSGGCQAVNEEDLENEIEEGVYCTEAAETTQFASISANGGLSQWKDVSNGDTPFFAHNINAWNGVLYRSGGCSDQDDSGGCISIHDDTHYAPINPTGDISTFTQSSPIDSGTCDGDDPYDCDLPPAGDGSAEGGQSLSATVMVNGYIYVIGGCQSDDCTDTTGNTSYAQISPHGHLEAPDECDGDYAGAWCVDSTNQINGNSGVAAASATTFTDTIYVVGGVDGNGNTNAIFYNEIEPDGTLSGGWQSQDLSGGAGIGASDVAYAFTHTRSNPFSAETTPGNLYIFGGCEETSGADCINDSYTDSVYKCDIQADGSIDNCATDDQLQIDSVSGSSDPGLAMHSGAIYADYVYLVGGRAPSVADVDSVRYAQFDNDNNVVEVDNSGWEESSSTLTNGISAGNSFAHNGYIYSLGGLNDEQSEILDEVEFAQIDPSDGSLSPFAASNTTIGQRWGHGVAVSSAKAYIFGGCEAGNSIDSCSQLDSSVLTIQIHNNESGAAQSYESADNLFDTDRIAASSAVVDGYLYIAGGCIDSASCEDITDNVQYAPIDSQGNVGSWSATSSLPDVRAWGRLEAVGGTLYYIGGQNGPLNPVDDVYYAETDSGNISSWSTSTYSLPEPLTLHSTAVWEDRIYVSGGESSSREPRDNVYVSPDLSSDADLSEDWATATSFNVDRRGHTLIAYADNLYILGGYDGDNYLNDVQVAPINSDGTLGDWKITATMPKAIQQADGFAANGYIYLFGGRTGDEEEDCLDTTYVAPVNINNENGEAPGLGNWYQAGSRFGGERFGISASYYEGRSYLLGGGCAELLNVSETFEEPGEFTFTPPEDTAEVVVEAWGAGGGGGQGEDGGDNAAGAGGGGGGYSRGSMPVQQQGYTLNVGGGGGPGSDGGNSWFDDESSIFAEGGEGASWGPSFGSGGSANIGNEATFSGGDGGTGFDTAQPFNRRGGGGGGSAFNNADGGDGEDGSGQAGSGSGGEGEGDGGDASVDEGTGDSGQTPGGGGGGGGYRGIGGGGSDGLVVVFYDEWNELVLTGANRVSVGNLLPQPQVADYSYMIDAETEIFPTHWLIGGANDSIYPPWSSTHQSSTGAESAWGEATNFESVPLFEPQEYTALDTSADPTDFARYYYFTFSIDQSHTFGFGSSPASSPSISSLSLFFDPDPARRMRHDKTFMDGRLQPLNTPF